MYEAAMTELRSQCSRRSGRDPPFAFRWLASQSHMLHQGFFLGSILAMQFVSPSGILNAVAGSALDFPRPAGYVPTEASELFQMRDASQRLRVMHWVSPTRRHAFMLELLQDGDNVIDGSSSNVHAASYRFVLP